MSKQIRRKFKAEFKAKVALEAIKEQETIESISKKYDIHPNQVNTWKKEFKDKAALLFEQDLKSAKDDQETLIQNLYAQIGELKVANDWLKKKLKL